MKRTFPILLIVVLFTFIFRIGVSVKTSGRNAYQVLGINDCSSFEKIGTAHRNLLEKYHPDNLKTGDPHLYFQVFRNYEKIKTEKRRAEYNRINNLCSRTNWKREFGSKKTKEIIVGIDLGTKFSSIGIRNKNGNVELLRNEHGSKLTESIVGFPENGKAPIVGKSARSQIRNKKRIVFDSKRFMGLPGDDVRVRKIIQHLPILETISIKNKVLFSLPNSKDSNREYITPEYVGSLILRYLKNLVFSNHKAEKDAVIKAVISVPSNFDHSQREATKHAAWLAGLEVIKFVTEPNAASIANVVGEGEGLEDDSINRVEYYKSLEKGRKSLVIDFGGGTLDLAYVEFDGEDFRVLDNGGNAFLGGEDFTHMLLNDILEKYKAGQKSDGLGKRIFDYFSGNNVNSDIREDVVIQELLEKVEEAKRSLAIHDEHEIALVGPPMYYSKIERKAFELICNDLFEKFEDTLDKFTEKIYDEIDDVVIVGGSMNLKRAENIVRALFPYPDFNIVSHVDFEEAIAIGATIEAVKIIEGKTKLPDIADITTFNLGVSVWDYEKIRKESDREKFKKINKKSYGQPPENMRDLKFWKKYVEKVNGTFDVLIERRSKLPATNTRSYPAVGNVNSIRIGVFQGEGGNIKDEGVTELGVFVVKNLESKKPRVEVTFTVDEDGLFVSVEEVGSKSKTTTNIEIEFGQDESLVDLLKLGMEYRKFKSVFTLGPVEEEKNKEFDSGLYREETRRKKKGRKKKKRKNIGGIGTEL